MNLISPETRLLAAADSMGLHLSALMQLIFKFMQKNSRYTCRMQKQFNVKWLFKVGLIQCHVFCGQ